MCSEGVSDGSEVPVWGPVLCGSDFGAVSPWISHLTILSLHFLFRRAFSITARMMVIRTQWKNICALLSSSNGGFVLIPTVSALCMSLVGTMKVPGARYLYLELSLRQITYSESFLTVSNLTSACLHFFLPNMM